ncbi:LuxR C-terminal-related transcriptional regulator [Streptomyces angustmyceticus]|nr:LuxR C-terminal-related transcriptional regulator [Streptomyces angustmyceticus]UAL68462.1 LuxR C-terminal-related transcriptional regulator [Streptomyces angustmyceticus]
MDDSICEVEGEPPSPCTARELIDISTRLKEEAERVQKIAATLPAESSTRSNAHSERLIYVEDVREISRSIQASVRSVSGEVLTAQPDGPRPRDVLNESMDVMREHLERGVSMRTLYHHSARFDAATKDYVRIVIGYGAQVRTLPEFFERIIIVDRATAFIPANAERTAAVKVEEPAVVSFLVDVFERAWSLAKPYPFSPSFAAQAASEVIPSIRETIKSLLVDGRTDKEISRRLAISQRALQSHISQMKKDFGAENRFQLGYILGREAK